ncbi:MAG: DinB family protein [Pseudonocardia sp.]
MTPQTSTRTGERADLLETLAQHRFFLRNTARDLTDEQAARRPTVSELCVGGLIKHVAEVERRWADFVVVGTTAMQAHEGSWEEHANSFRLLPGETLASVLDGYAEVARRTDELVATLPDLDVSHPLPEAPWFEAGKRWSARRVFLHIVAETAQHAGHADILREAIDGAKSMG